jgi:Leucine-rich repeat (LRR) protein
VTNDSSVKKILILAANPKNSVPLRLDEEVREIDEGLKRAQMRDRFELEQKWAVRPRDVQRAILDFAPQIVHFSGHGVGEGGLALEDELGQAQLVSTSALAGLFELFADQVECVLLNACYSVLQAEAIALHIPYVIGMNQAVGDRAAREFAVGFYDALGAGRDIEFAYKFACNSIRLAGIPEEFVPVLKRQVKQVERIKVNSYWASQFVAVPTLNVESTKILTWLHLSDLHACKPKTGWDAKRVTNSLCSDLKEMQKERNLRPDLIFFTGDAAYGHLGTSDGKSITEQFREAHDFFTTVRESFDPPIEQRNLFLVPGNHDVNRIKISKFETQALESIKSLDEVTSFIKDGGVEWQRIISRLNDYEHFLQTYGYDHLLTGRDRLIYVNARECNGLRVGIAGFNSAWSSRGIGRDEMGRLWMAGRFQLETLNEQMPPNDFKIALLHHPSNWLVPEENPAFGRQLERDFPFVIHGHEHQDYVRSDASNGHTVISTGACHEWSESKNNGYNFVRLDFAKGNGKVFLRQYDATGGGWIPRIIHGKTDDRGCWPLEHLKPWMEKLLVTSDVKSPIADGVRIFTEINASNEVDNLPGTKGDQAKDYEARYRNAVASKLDYMELFGIELPRESKEYSLTVAYVSLNLADEEQEDLELEELEDDVSVVAQTAFPAEQVFDRLSGRGRLLIRGMAGSGKTTLLRWAAVQSARNESTIQKKTEDTWFFDETDDKIPNIDCDWRQQIPFIIRLRDCTNGQLPRPSEYPLLLARELPDPPSDWIDNILRNGRALIMFDGVDEVPQQIRAETMRAIRDLIDVYPQNSYVVTTRPEAVERLEFIERGFISARVESMAVAERNEFIDRWHDAMEVRLRNFNKPNDLRPLAKRLKHRLEGTPAIARLTSNPLLCAVVCALHRMRNENLPETPVDLCEKLCEMLLDRHDKERLGVESQQRIDEAYGKLEFRVRKGLLSQLAYYMVNAGISAITEVEADRQIAKALQSYSSTDVSAKAIRRALVERSGMLQESSEQKIEFLHNTLKEFLAAERFVNIGDFQILADHADDASWQPVILFAVALPRDGSRFTTNLVRTILQKTSIDAPPKGRSKEARSDNAKIRARQFFLFRCYTNAYQINDPDIQEAFKLLSQQLLPPRNMTDAAALASCGEAIIPYLKNREELKAAERAACVRTLGLIGNEQANNAIKDYLSDTTLSVAQELAVLVNDWSQILVIEQHVNNYGSLPIQIPGIFQNLNPLKNLTNLTRLDLSGRVNDISALTNLTNLTYLDLSETQVSEISALANLTSLEHLNLSKTQVTEISDLANLTNLKYLDLSETEIRENSVFANLTSLKHLDLRRTQVSEISILVHLTKLTHLNLGETHINNISSLANLIDLTHLDLYETYINDVSALANLTNLLYLDLSAENVNDISILANIKKLSQLSICGTQVNDISSIASLTNLISLNLIGVQVNDISSLSKLPNLIALDLFGVQINDISVIATLSNLEYLDLGRTMIKDISALTNLKKLVNLSVSGTKINSITALNTLTSLTHLDLSGIQINDISALATLENLTYLNLSGTPINDIVALATLKNLSYLHLWGTNVIDITTITNLTNLRELYIMNTQTIDFTSADNLILHVYMDQEIY